MIAPIVTQLAEEYDGKVTVAKCDVEEAEDIAMRFGIRNIPTLLFFKEGKNVGKLVGAVSKDKIKQQLDGLLPAEG